MPALFDYYRDQVAYCEKMAASEPVEQLKADWLRLAGRWLELASGSPLDVDFQTESDAKNTRQRRSSSSH